MSTPLAVDGIDGLKSLVGKQLGPSEPIEVTQEMVNLFADATGDHQWIHVEPERARKESPFGGPIAHGYLTLSLSPLILPQLMSITGFSMGVNYGTDKVRFPSPVPVGGKIRGSAVVDEVTDIQGGVQLRVNLTVEVEGASKPACVATLVLRQYV